MKIKKPFVHLPILAILGLCLFSILLFVFQRAIYKWQVGLVISKPHIFQVDNSRRVAIQVYPNAKGIEWFGTRWTDNGKSIEVYASRAQVYANVLMSVDPENPSYSNDTQIFEGENILGITDELPFALEDRESLWAGCQKENLFFTAKYLDNKYGFWETRLWKDGQLIKTFQPIKFHFDLYQSGFNDSPIGWTMEYSHFSPDCRYAIISFSKDVWLLDTVDNTFSIIFTARQFIDLHDIVEGNHQFIWPSWAPNSQDFVFGDATFGLEKYNVQSKKRSWLLAPGIAGGVNGVIEWSKTGKWVLADSGKGLVIISSAGNRMGILNEGCESMENIAWSSNDKIAFICKDYNKATCVGGKCPDERDYLVIWDLSNLDSK